MFLVSCNKDDTDGGPAAATIVSPAISNPDFSWTGTSQLGVFGDLASGNSPFEVSGVDASGKATFSGQIAGNAGTLYAYYPYDPSVGRNPRYVHFNLPQYQFSADNAANTFLVATPVEGVNLKAPVEMIFNQVCATLELRITTPAAATIVGVSITCEDEPFYIQTIADITTDELSFAPRSAISARPTLTLYNSSTAPTAAGGVFTGKLLVFPDHHTRPVKGTVLTDNGCYDFDCTSIAGAVDRGDRITVNYTLNAADWYDPSVPPLPTISATAQPSPNPIRTPIKVVFSNVIGAGLTPATITFTPADPTGAVTYTLTAKDIATGETVVGFGESNKYLQPSTPYTIQVLDASQTVLANSSATTQAAMVDADMTIVNPGADLSTIVTGTSRKSKIFLMPGAYTNTTNPVIAKDLILFGDSPSNTVVNASAFMIAQGTIAKLDFSGFTWKASTGHFLRAYAYDSTGPFDITDLSFHNFVFDFSAAPDGVGYGIIFWPRARAEANNTSEHRGLVRNYVIDDMVYIGTTTTNPDDFYAVVLQSGSDYFAQYRTITVKNSTFVGIPCGLMTLPSTAGTPPAPVGVDQVTLNGGVQPVITVENNTFYKVACKSGPGAASAVIHTGSGTYSFTPTLSIKHNIIVFGGSVSTFNIVNCTFNTQDLNQSNYLDNWGLEGQAWNFRSSLSSFPELGSKKAATLFSNPMDNPLANGASFHVTHAAASGAGDPRW
ncbi:hypothetical protein FACS1894159_03720 [Bacteroidia bacterium]|nr:hypothetical protein FACS1894159_03720 [Bacteroidia bacterium]